MTNNVKLTKDMSPEGLRRSLSGEGDTISDEGFTVSVNEIPERDNFNKLFTSTPEQKVKPSTATTATQPVARRPVVQQSASDVRVSTPRAEDAKKIPSYTDTIKKETAMSENHVHSDEVTILSSRITMRESNMDTQDDMIIYGRYEDGVLTCRTLTIAEGAVVTGEIHAREIRNLGTINGTIHSHNFYAYTGSLTDGSVTTCEIGVQRGAKMSAKIETVDAEEEIEHSEEPTNFDNIPVCETV